jgi:hypothetical protein
MIEAIGKSIPGEQYCLSSLPLSNHSYFLYLLSNDFNAFFAILSLSVSPLLDGR